MGSREISKPHCVDQLKNRGVGAYPKCKGEDANHREWQVQTQDASPGAHILEDRSDEASARLFTQGDCGRVDMLDALQGIGEAPGVKFRHYGVVGGLLTFSPRSKLVVAVPKVLCEFLDDLGFTLWRERDKGQPCMKFLLPITHFPLL